MDIIKSHDHFKKFSKEFVDIIKKNPSKKLSEYREDMSQLLIGNNYATLTSIFKNNIDKSSFIDIREGSSGGKCVYFFGNDNVCVVPSTPENNEYIYDSIHKFLSSGNTISSAFFSYVFNYFKQYAKTFKIDTKSLVNYSDDETIQSSYDDEVFYGYQENSVKENSNLEEFIYKVQNDLTTDYSKLTYSNPQTLDFLSGLREEDLKELVRYPSNLSYAVIEDYLITHSLDFLGMIAYEKLEGKKFDFNHHLAAMIFQEVIKK